MCSWKTPEEFYLYPSFEINTDLTKYEVPFIIEESIKNIFIQNDDSINMEQIIQNKLLISGLNSSERSLKAKERYQIFQEYRYLGEKYPFLLLILAESYFWLENIDTCIEIIIELREIIGYDSKIDIIIKMLEEYIKQMQFEDDLYHNNEGSEKIDDAILCEYNRLTKLCNLLIMIH